MQKFESILILSMLAVLTAALVYAGVFFLPLSLKKLQYEVEVFEDSKCTSLGYEKRGKK